MQVTISIDDQLLAAAKRFAGVTEDSAVVHAALTAYVEREAARRLAEMGGSDPHATAPPRRRLAMESWRLK
jgi:Arc/MetJ family transcription regulator